MQTHLAKLEAIIPTLATREDLAKQTAETMDRMDRLINGLRSDFDRKFILCITVQFTTLLAIIGMLSRIANIF